MQTDTKVQVEVLKELVVDIEGNRKKISLERYYDVRNPSSTDYQTITMEKGEKYRFREPRFSRVQGQT